MILIPDIAGRSFLVLGYGKSGKATGASLRASGARAFVWDDKETLRARACEEGNETLDPEHFDFSTLEGIIVAPGVPLTHPAPHPLILKAQESHVPILSDMDLLFKAQPEATYVGITGTNGKSTTTALIGHILEQAGRAITVGGNIGVPALSLPPLGKDGIYVLELSSYQLDLIRGNPLRVAVWLNLTPDHIDRHGSMEGYRGAKEKIIRKDGPQTLILGIDEPEMQEVAVSITGDGNVKLSLINAVQHLDLSQAKALPGAHNAQNARAAFLACEALGLSREEISSGINSFPGLAHRQQFIREMRGVRFINDSKATNANAAGKALICYDPIYWIAGGKPKEGGLAGLEPFVPRIAHAFLIGQAEADFALWCERQGLPFTCCGTLDVALRKAADLAWEEKREGSVVLLSPACASFDQFSGFEERGAHFEKLVRSLVEPA